MIRGWIIFCLSLCCAVIARAEDATVFEAPSGEKVRAWFVLPTRMVMDDADLPFTGEPKEMEICAGRGESECVQLVVLVGQTLEKASVEFSEFRADDKVLATGQFRGNIVAAVPGKVPAKPVAPIKAWNAESFVSSAKTIPDALLRDASFDLPAGYSRVWVTVNVPKDQAPGTYRGEVRVKHGTETLLKAPLAVRVWRYVLPEESSINVMADVEVAKRATFETVRPLFEDLKAHRVNATGPILPLGAWQRDQPPPDTGEYEKALKFVLDDLGFRRFEFPSGRVERDETWAGTKVFDDPIPLANVTWIAGGEFVESDPPVARESAPRWRRVGAEDAQLSSARLEGTTGKSLPWVQYSFESKEDEQLWIWLQVDAQHPDERKIVSVDGKEIGVVTGAQSLDDALRFVRIDTPISAAKGKHEVRVAADGIVGSADPICALVLTNDPQADMEQAVRKRAVLSPAFEEAFKYHADQAADWLRKHGWMKKAQLRLEDQVQPGELGRTMVLYDFAGTVLPSARRELAAEPSMALRKSVEVWTPGLRSGRGTVEQWNDHLEMGDEVWVSDNALLALGYPAVGVRVMPWVLGAAGVENLRVGLVNYWPGDPWKETSQHGLLMRQTLLYPAPNGQGAIDSVRWELLRQGLEDCEMLRMLRETVDAASASGKLSDEQKRGLAEGHSVFEEELPRLIRGVNDFSWDAGEVERVRKRAGEALSVLSVP